MTESSPLADLTFLPPYLERTRWFGGKGRPYEISGVERLGLLGDGDPTVDLLLVTLSYADGDTERYQVPLTYYTHPEHRLDHAFVGWWEDPDLGWVHAYDALHDRESTGLWLRAFGGGDTSASGLTFHRVEGHELDLEAPGTLFAGEQSNSSIAFGDDSVLKLFRKVTPGLNPDITTHQALTAAGSEHVAHLYGWVECDVDGLPTHLGMLQQFLRTATDGWDLALTSVRNLFADPELAAREAGGDFSGEAGRLGEALRAVHEDLATLGTGTLDAADLAADMAARLDAAVLVVPALAEHAPALRTLYDRLAGLGDVTVQTVHGDLHLGQTLRTAAGWKIVDFEGEPAKTLAERVLPDSPWRDVAGMLRSLDYAAPVVERQRGETDDEGADDRHRASSEWAERNQRYFLAAYAGETLTPEQRTLVDAYVADKAVYETVYETRNRPDWVEIPLSAVARIGTA